MDNYELNKLALAATPGRIHDRLDSCGGGLKYTCNGDDGSLVLSVDHKNDTFGFLGTNAEADEAFFLKCTPAAVLALIAENERLAADNASMRGSLKSGAAMAKKAIKDGGRAARERDALKAECEGLRKHAPSTEIIWCECGDGYPANSYGAGFMDANDGVCENCNATYLYASQSTSAKISDALGRHKGEIAAERAAVKRDGLVEAQKACDRIAGDSAGRSDRERKGAGECSAAIRALIVAMSKESGQ